jgi:hypothetical protein
MYMHGAWLLRRYFSRGFAFEKNRSGQIGMSSWSGVHGVGLALVLQA